MKKSDLERMAEALKSAMAPVTSVELQQDLWPQMLRQLDQRAAQARWFDWALGGIAAILLLLSPEVVPVLLYHL